MSDTVKYQLPDDRVPRSWYNIVADLPEPPVPVLHPATGAPIGPDDLAPLFPPSLIALEMATDREIAATASNDPRIRELRAKRADLRKRARDVEMMMGSAGMVQQMAQGVRGERLNEAQTRLTAMQQGVQTRAENALNAVTQGFDYSVLKDSAEGGFIQGMARATAADAGGNFGTTPGAMAVRTLWEEMKMWALGTGAGDEAFAEAKATEFLKNGGAMAAALAAAAPLAAACCAAGPRSGSSNSM